MIIILVWSAFISTLTLTIASGLHWLFPTMFFIGLFFAFKYDPDITKEKTKSE